MVERLWESLYWEFLVLLFGIEYNLLAQVVKAGPKSRERLRDQLGAMQIRNSLTVTLCEFPEIDRLSAPTKVPHVVGVGQRGLDQGAQQKPCLHYFTLWMIKGGFQASNLGDVEE